MDDKQCLLVIIGESKDGRKELIALEGGYQESEHSWFSILVDLRRRGLVEAPKLAIGDSSLGFWKALTKTYDKTRWQRCWVHKTANILNKLPKSIQAKAKENIHEIWITSNNEEAEKSFDAFIDIYEAKYPKAVECLKKDRDVLLTFYDFPASPRTANIPLPTIPPMPIETAPVSPTVRFSALMVNLYFFPF